jgi:hypothetical protein
MPIQKTTFHFGFSIILIILFFVHQTILKSYYIPLSNSKLIESYLINGLLVISFFLLIKFKLQKIKTNLGFIFIAFSLLKFVLFFIFIYPTYKLDSSISTVEFTSFFIPYFICLFTEIFFLTKLLNNLKF